MKKIIILGLILMFLVFLIGCSQKQGNSDVCGDDRCTGQETRCNCNEDCGPWEGSLRIMKECSNAAPLQDNVNGGCTNAQSGC
jgi:hypothetical protein